eukprot:Partr_v1_DN28244_c4_g1_i2_m76028 putative alkaline ceramidase
MSARIIEGGHMGHWSPRTSTLDWCEENYVVMHYIAEFWNTISNGSFMLLALLGVYRWWRFGLELRFLVAYLSLFVIGVGSAFFHATLLYEMQLLDELPVSFYTSDHQYPLTRHLDAVWSGRAVLLHAGEA